MENRVMIIYTNLVPKPYAGIAIWPFILIKPAYKDDATILPHEMVHYKRQAWWSPVWWLLYLLSSKFRLKEEVLAYKVSIEHGMSPLRAAFWLTSYHPTLIAVDALELLEGES